MRGKRKLGMEQVASGELGRVVEPGGLRCGSIRNRFLAFVVLQYQYTCCFKYLLWMGHGAINVANTRHLPASATPWGPKME